MMINTIKIASILVAQYFKKQMIAYLKYKLSTDKRWCLRALQVIYNHQTIQQIQDNQTKHLNNVGFNSNDAKIMSSIYVFYKQKQFISPKQLQICFRIMPKYAKQIFERIQSFDKSKLQRIMDNDKDYKKMLQKKDQKQLQLFNNVIK